MTDLFVNNNIIAFCRRHCRQITREELHFSTKRMWALTLCICHWQSTLRCQSAETEWQQRRTIWRLFDFLLESTGLNFICYWIKNIFTLFLRFMNDSTNTWHWLIFLNASRSLNVPCYFFSFLCGTLSKQAWGEVGEVFLLFAQPRWCEKKVVDGFSSFYACLHFYFHSLFIFNVSKNPPFILFMILQILRPIRGDRSTASCKINHLPKIMFNQDFILTGTRH